MTMPAADRETTRITFNRPRPAEPGSAAPIFQHVLDKNVELLGGPRPGTAVDLGCHWGRYTVVLAELFDKVIGIDIAEAALATAQTRPNVSYACLDLDDDPDGLLAYAPVNFFLAVGLFEILRSPGSLLRGMYAAAGEGGEALIVVPNRLSVNYRSLRAALWIRSALGKGGAIHNNGLDMAELTRLATAAGFVPASQGAIVGLPVYLIALLPHAVQRWLLPFDRFFLRLWGGGYLWLRCRKDPRPRTAGEQ